MTLNGISDRVKYKNFIRNFSELIESNDFQLPCYTEIAKKKSELSSILTYIMKKSEYDERLNGLKMTLNSLCKSI